MKYQNIIDNMTLKEKAAFLSGKSEWQTRDFPRLDIPAIFCSDGPNGVRKQAGAGDHLGINPAVPATCFPTAAAMANSWDEELEQRVGVALGEESMEEDVNVLLGPGLNIKRNPLCGRNFRKNGSCFYPRCAEHRSSSLRKTFRCKQPGASPYGNERSGR